MVGETLSHYRIVGKLGSGGMGEVWKAEDTKLKRMVALKTLPRWNRSDTRLRARFEREAQAIAALNHPNIVTVYSVEEANGLLFVTMELVAGQTLTHSLKSALPLDRLFSVAIPLADAVAAAHDREILHRDLKPDNVMLTEEGTVKVLDFGLAKLREDADEPVAVPGSNESLTQEGKVVGTAAYMSPEQAEGQAVGPQSDVFSLGVMLYQMACGERPFSGGTPMSLISSILKDDPRPVTEVRGDLPRHLGRIVRRCLAKNPSRRYATAHELRNELESLREELATTAGDPEAPPAPSRIRPILTAASLVLLAALAAAGWMRTPVRRAEAGARVSQQTYYGGVETDPALSPDGQFLAYTGLSADGDQDVFLQRVDGRNPINLTEESADFDGSAAFSPDGTHIAFRSDRDGGGLYVMGATGEHVRRITDFGFDPAWSPDGSRIAFATERVVSPLGRSILSELWIVEIETGQTKKIHDGDAVHPAWSPNGHRIAFWTAHIGQPRAEGQRDVVTVLADGSDPVWVTNDAAVDWRPQWSPDGRELYFASDRGGSMNLWRVAIEERTGEPHGEERPFTTPSLYSGPFALSVDGSRVAYVARDERSRLIALGFDPSAGVVSGDPMPVTGGAFSITEWDIAPDGSWIAFADRGRPEDLYLVHPDGKGLRKLTDDIHKDRGVSWIDENRLLFYSTRGGGYEIWTVRRDGSDLRQITETEGNSLWMPRVSPDGTRMMAHNSHGTYLFDFTGDELLRKEQAQHVASVEGVEGVFRGLRWSPDGSKILGYVQTALHTGAGLYDERTGEVEVFSAPAGGDSVATDWLPDGRRFLATAGGQAWVVDAETGGWSELPVRVGTGAAQLAPDGSRLLFVETTTEADIWVAWIK